jgi:alpha-glucosidase
MTDPAVAYLPGGGYDVYNRGTAMDVWLKSEDGSPTLGVVWPGESVESETVIWTELFLVR